MRSVLYPFEALPKIADFVRALGASLPKDTYEKIGEDVYLRNSARYGEGVRNVTRAEADACGNSLGEIMYGDCHNEKHHSSEPFVSFGVFFSVCSRNLMQVGYELINKVKAHSTRQNSEDRDYY